MDNQNPNASESTDSSASKPTSRRVYWILALLGLITLIVVGSNILASASRKANPHPTNRALPGPMSSDGINSDEARERAEAERLAAQAAALKAQADKEKADLDALLNGKEDIPPETPPQRAARRGLQSNGRTSAADERKKRLQDAYRSSMVVVDESPERAQVSAPANPTAPAKQPNAAAETAEAEQPTPVSTTKREDKKNKYDWDTFTGKLYRLFEGTVLECVLTNRLQGEFTGPVNVMVTTDAYSNNRQEMLIPQGTRILGEATRVGTLNQQRLAVAFHRLIMPDGFSWDLDKFKGLDQVGSTGLKDKVNNHYLQAFGFSLAVGAIAGLAQVGNSTSGFGYDPGVSIRNGMTQQLGQEATQILDRFLNQLPTITIREGHRVRVWLSNDLEIPAYANHTIPGDL